MKDKTIAVILAAGIGERFKSELPKQFFKVGGKTILEHTIDIFEHHPRINSICIVINPTYKDLFNNILSKNKYKKIFAIIEGGRTRQESSRNAIFYLRNKGFKYILTHDAIRPLLSHDIINNILNSLKKYKSVDIAIPTADTIIKVDDKNIIQDIPERKYIMRGQTPQGFQFETIEKAHRMALEEGFESSPDDCYLVLRYKLADTYVVEGSENNIKITYQIDLHLLDKLFQLKSQSLTDINLENLKEIIKNKKYIIFGGTKGIGKAICELSNSFGAYAYCFGSDIDVRKPEVVKKTISSIYKKHGEINGIIITAGLMKQGKLENIGLDYIYEQIETNLTGSIIVSKYSIPYLKKSQGYLTLFASSSYTLGREEYTIYSASKAGVVNFMQGLSQELSDYNIKVNVINPERTLTPMRIQNFPNDDKSLLLDPYFVGLCTLNLMTKNITGAVIDVRKQMENQQLLKEVKNILIS